MGNEVIVESIESFILYMSVFINIVIYSKMLY